MSAPDVGQRITADGDALRLCYSGRHDSEVERRGTIAAKGVGEGDTILAFCRVGLTVPSVGLAMADSDVLGGAHFGLVDGEV